MAVMTTIEESFTTYHKVVDPEVATERTNQDRSQFWDGLTTLLQLIPMDYLVATPNIRVDVRHLVLGHLHDTGDRQWPSSFP